MAFLSSFVNRWRTRLCDISDVVQCSRGEISDCITLTSDSFVKYMICDYSMQIRGLILTLWNAVTVLSLIYTVEVEAVFLRRLHVCTYNCEVHVYRKHLLYPLLSDAINITHKHASLLRAIACLWQCRPRKCINFETFNKYTMWYMYCTLVYATVSLFVLSSSPVSGAVRLDGCAGMGEIFSSSVTINPS